jgi:hypothetical protein
MGKSPSGAMFSTQALLARGVTVPGWGFRLHRKVLFGSPWHSVRGRETPYYFAQLAKSGGGGDPDQFPNLCSWAGASMPVPSKSG